MVTSGIKQSPGVAHRSINQPGATPESSVSLKTSFPPLPGRESCLPQAVTEESPSCTPVDLQLSFPYTVAVMGGSEVPKLLKPDAFPL